MIVRDTSDGSHYHAMAILHNVEHPERPPMLVRIYDLLLEERFKEVASTLTCDNLATE